MPEPATLLAAVGSYIVGKVGSELDARATAGVIRGLRSDPFEPALQQAIGDAFDLAGPDVVHVSVSGDGYVSAMGGNELREPDVRARMRDVVLHRPPAVDVGDIPAHLGLLGGIGEILRRHLAGLRLPVEGFGAEFAPVDSLTQLEDVLEIVIDENALAGRWLVRFREQVRINASRGGPLAWLDGQLDRQAVLLDGQALRVSQQRIQDRLDELPVRTADEVATRALLTTRREPTWPVRVGVVPQLADRYQEREVTPRLRRAPAESRMATQILTGMGGVGKTQIAAHYAEQQWARRAVDLLVWVTATARSGIVTGYAKAAVSAGVPGADERNPDDAARRFLEWLATTDRRWLIVLDDLQDPADMNGLWPSNSPTGQVMVTTRRRDPSLAREDRALVEVEVFTPADSEAYVNAKLVGQPHLADGAAALAADLGHLPLALAQAVAYMANRGLTAHQYRQRLAESRKSLREVLPEPGELPDDHQRTVDATWSLSVELADALKPQGMARPLLETASLLDPNGIPDAVFTTRPVLDHLADLLGRSVTSDDVRDALYVLHRLSLANVDLSHPHRAARVHALVQHATRDTLPDVDRVGRMTADALLAVWPDNHTDADLAQVLRSNTQALQVNTPDSLWRPDAHPVLIRTGRSLAEASLVVDAVVFFTKLHLACADHLGDDHPHTFTIRHHVAHSRAEIYDFAGAAAEYEGVLADQRRVLGDEHPMTLTARSSLAHWRGKAGDATGAVTELEQVLADQRRVLGDDHPDILATRYRLAHWRDKTGDAMDAVKELHAVLADQQRALGDDHPTTLTTRSELADWRGNAGDAMGAVMELQALLTDQRRVLGDDHPTTLTTRGMAAVWRSEMGDPKGAITDLQGLLTDQRRVLGDDHGDTLTTLDILTELRDEVPDTSNAVSDVAELLANLRRALGDDHPATLATRFSLANYRGVTGDVAGAVSELEGLLADQRRVMGDVHPSTFATRYSLALGRGQIGDAAGAVVDLAELLADHRRLVGDDHPATFATRFNLANYRGVAGDVVGAVSELEGLLADHLRVLGEDHPATLATTHNLAHWRQMASRE